MIVAPMNYDSIKALAKELGVRVPELLALAPQNDPYYNGTASTIAKAEWFADIWRRVGCTSGVHLRRIHYWAISQHGLLQANGLPYENTDNCWGYLDNASMSARYLGLVPLEGFVDRKNPGPHDLTEYEDPSVSVSAPLPDDPSVDVDGFGVNAAQVYHLEIWCEKSTMNDILLPICSEAGAVLQTGAGELSLTLAVALVNRIEAADKPARIFFISDFDPAGQSIPRALARKVEWLVGERCPGHDVKLARLMLTADQAQEYELPRTPIKDGEKRAGAFEARHGEGATELDALEALHPGVFANIVRQAIRPYRSQDVADRVADGASRLRQAIDAEVDEITGRYEVHLEALKEMQAEVEAIDIDPLEYLPADAEPDAADDDGRRWLYDSARDYITQIAEYKGNVG